MLPVYVLIRFVEYDAENDVVLPLSQNTPLHIQNVDGIPCFPVFTSTENAQRFRKKGGTKDVIIECNAERIRNILDELKPPMVVINPTGERGESATYYRTQDFLEDLIDPT